MSYSPCLSVDVDDGDVVEPFESDFFMPSMPPVVPPTTAAITTSSMIDPMIHLSRLLPVFCLSSHSLFSGSDLPRGAKLP
jgi:hypothetical protein